MSLRVWHFSFIKLQMEKSEFLPLNDLRIKIKYNIIFNKKTSKQNFKQKWKRLPLQQFDFPLR